jgi:hypothetical protein
MTGSVNCGMLSKGRKDSCRAKVIVVIKILLGSPMTADS